MMCGPAGNYSIPAIAFIRFCRRPVMVIDDDAGMPERPSGIDVWASRLVALISLFFVVMAVSEIISVLTDDSLYPFGWEEGGWRYSSKYAYLTSMTLDVLIFGGIMAACFGRAVWRRVGQLVFAVWMIYHISIVLSYY